MNGELSQLVALAAHGNAFLSGASSVPRLDGTSALKWIRSIRFEDGSQDEWFTRLRDRAATRLSLGAETIDPRLAGFANAGRWWIVATLPGRREGWRAVWTVTDQSAPDHRIWSVVYSRAENGPEPAEPRPGPARTALQQALEAAVGFCAQNDTGFGDTFERSLAFLGAEQPETDLLPPVGYGPAARQLLGACDRAWVFGGMGSWNDVSFEDKVMQAEYETLSRRLFAAVLEGIVTATNSFDGATR